MNISSFAKAWLPAGLMLLQGCAGVADVSWDAGRIPASTPAHFTICYNHGCKNLAEVSLAPEQWRPIRELFAARPVTPEQERVRIAQAVGRLETLSGRLTGIDDDRGGSMSGLWMLNQMDCIDETTNTNTYLAMMYHDGLLEFHVPAGEARRILPYLFLHATAVIRETGTSRKYAVDSWFLDNGRPAYVIPLSVWRRGWTPGDEIPALGTDGTGGASSGS